MPIRIIRSVNDVPSVLHGSVLTIGNFDGVHLGHQKLLTQVIKQAQSNQAPSLVVTFEPHPVEFFHPNDLATPRLMRFREKFSALSYYPIDAILILKFNERLAGLTARDFIYQMLWQHLRPRHFVLGDDFHFGYQRQGDFALVQSMGKELGFSAESMETVCAAGERVSSTRIRTALLQGDLNLAKRLLGRPYTMLGKVMRGDQRGRQIGFPTANIFLHRKLTPVKGVYTVLVHGIRNKALPGVANVGVRPTVDGTRALLEVHLLDFAEDIYGCGVKIEFCEKVRDEVRYPNIDLLKTQIAKDVAYSRDYFKNYFKNHGVL